MFSPNCQPMEKFVFHAVAFPHCMETKKMRHFTKNIYQTNELHLREKKIAN